MRNILAFISVLGIGCSQQALYVHPAPRIAATPEEKCRVLVTALCDQMTRCSAHSLGKDYYTEMDTCRTYLNDSVPFTTTSSGKPMNRPPRCYELERVGEGFAVCIDTVRTSCNIPTECWQAFADDSDEEQG